MKIILSKIDVENITKNTGSLLITKIVNIIFKYTKPLENQIETYKKQLKVQSDSNRYKNMLLDEIIYHDIGLFYNEKEFLSNPEEYIKKIKNEIKRKKNGGLIVK